MGHYDCKVCDASPGEPHSPECDRANRQRLKIIRFARAYGAGEIKIGRAVGEYPPKD